MSGPRDQGGHREELTGVWPDAAGHRLAQAEPSHPPPGAALPAGLPAARFRPAGRRRPGRQAQDLLTQYGDLPRRYRNGLGLAVPERGQVEPLRRAVRYLKAIELVRDKRQALNLTTAQMAAAQGAGKHRKGGL